MQSLSAALTLTMTMHLLTVAPAAVLGTFLMLRGKGTRSHRLLGRLYMALMLTTAVISLFIPAAVGPQFIAHLGAIHLLSLVVIYCVPRAYFAARAHNIRAHKAAMMGVYFGGILVAGAFTLAPGRFLNQLLFS